MDIYIYFAPYSEKAAEEMKFIGPSNDKNLIQKGC